MFAALFVEACLTLCIEQLGAPRFRTREAVQKMLTPIAGEVVGLLERGMRHESSEWRPRCRLLYGPYAHDRAWDRAGHLFPRGWNKLPWIWLNNEYGSLASNGCMAAVRESGVKCGSIKNGWEDWRYGTRLWLTNELVLGRPVSILQDQLDVMADAEACWMLDELRRCGIFNNLPWR